MTISANVSGSTPPSNDAKAIHLLIADESQMGCELLEDTFRRSRGLFKVISCVISRDKIIQVLKLHRCDVALISDNLSDGPLTGFQALREIPHSFPKTRSVMLLKPNHHDLVIDAFRAGAKGVFSRTEPLNSLTKCIMAVHHGQIWANSIQLNSVLRAFADAAPLREIDSKRRNLLTKRETEVAKLAVAGLNQREIAQELHLPEHSIGHHLSRIYEKLGISSRVELALHSLEQRGRGNA
jgi:two-component system nitrate/nitrite response regulator NarL